LFLKKTCKYPCSITYIVVEASTVCTEDGRIDVLGVGLCVIILNTVSVDTECHVALDTSEYHRSLHAPPLNTCNIGVSCDCGQAIAFCVLCPVC